MGGEFWEEDRGGQVTVLWPRCVWGFSGLRPCAQPTRRRGSCAAPSTERCLWSPGSSVPEAAFSSCVLIDPIADVHVDSRRAPVGFGLGPGAPWLLPLTLFPWQAQWTEVWLLGARSPVGRRRDAQTPRVVVAVWLRLWALS